MASKFRRICVTLEIHSQVESQKSVTQVESKLNIENPKSCLVEAKIQARFELAYKSAKVEARIEKAEF